MPQNTDSPVTSPKNRTNAALLAILLGTFGIHQFYLGNKVSGIIRIVLTITFYGVLISLPLAIVEFVMYLIATDDEFHDTYVLRKISMALVYALGASRRCVKRSNDE